MHNNNTREFNKRLRPMILARDEFTCQVCWLVDESGDNLHIDHIVSKHEAGRLGWTAAEIDDPSNLQVLCSTHNLQKGKRTADERAEYWNPLYKQYQ